jgi:hypothetical protein
MAIVVATSSFLLFSSLFFFLRLSMLTLFYCAVAPLAADEVVATLVWFPATGIIFHTTPVLGMVGPPEGGINCSKLSC